MNTATKLKICDRSLGLTLILILVSGIQLEASSGSHEWTVWLHIGLGVVLTALSVYHIFLHYRFSNWFARFRKNRNKLTRMLWWVFLLTVVSGLAATAVWIAGNAHSHIGGLHGKIGFLMVIIGIIHAVRHKKNRRKKR